MAWSRKKYKKRQREYTRRMTQPSRIQAEAKKRNNIVRPILEQKAKEQRTANLFQNILGVVAAQGHGKNVIPTARAISKRTASNFLIQSMYPRQPVGSLDRMPIYYAIEKADVEKARELVKGMRGVLNRKNKRGMSALGFALHTLYNTKEKGADWETNKRTTDTIMIIEILLQEGAKIAPDESIQLLSLFWSLHPSITFYIAETYPSVKEATIKYKDALLTYFDDLIQYTEIDIEDERREFHRPSYDNNGGYGYVPRYLYDNLEEYESARYNILEFLQNQNIEVE